MGCSGKPKNQFAGDRSIVHKWYSFWINKGNWNREGCNKIVTKSQNDSEEKIMQERTSNDSLHWSSVKSPHTIMDMKNIKRRNGFNSRAS